MYWQIPRKLSPNSDLTLDEINEGMERGNRLMIFPHVVISVAGVSGWRGTGAGLAYR